MHTPPPVSPTHPCRAWSRRSRYLLLAVALALAASCKRRVEPPEQPRPRPQTFTGDELPALADQGTPATGGTLRVALPAEPPSLNSQLDPLDAWGKKIAELVMESLAQPDPRTWSHVPRLAERWETSEDNLTLTFHLRRGVKWHDGKPFTADDVLFTFDKLLAPSSKTMAKRSFLEPLAAYEKLDAHTVRFRFSEPYWFALDAVAEIVIYPKHVYAKGDFNTHPANRAPVGTGPFAFVHWKTGDEIALARHGGYHGPRPHLERILFRYVPDPTARIQMLLRGDVDVVETVTPEQWRRLAAQEGLGDRFWRLRHVPSSLQWIGWNEERPMFSDARVRRALTMLLDRRDIIDNLRLGLDTPAVSWFYPGTLEHELGLAPLPYAPDQAAKLLEEAGWRDSDGDGLRDRGGVPFRFTFLYPAGPPFYEQLASLMQSDFRKAGIEVATARVEWAVYMERLRRHEFDACSLLWQMAPRNDPYQVWHSSEIHGGSNFVSFRHEDSDRLLEQARLELDEGKRVALYRRFNRILYDEQPYTLLFNRHNLSLVAKRFGGIVSTPYGIFSYADFYVKTEEPPPAP